MAANFPCSPSSNTWFLYAPVAASEIGCVDWIAMPLPWSAGLSNVRCLTPAPAPPPLVKDEMSPLPPTQRHARAWVHPPPPPPLSCPALHALSLPPPPFCLSQMQFFFFRASSPPLHGNGVTGRRWGDEPLGPAHRTRRIESINIDLRPNLTTDDRNLSNPPPSISC